MGFELSQGKETLHHPDKLHVHLRDNSVWGRNVQLDCVHSVSQLPQKVPLGSAASALLSPKSREPHPSQS